jgi:hypothetical protein
MSSRVEQDQAKAADDAERAAKRMDKDAREAKNTTESRERFTQLLKSGQEAVRSQKDTNEKSQKESKEGGEQNAQRATGKDNAERTARMARGGMLSHQKVMDQVKGFESTLQQQGAQAQEANKGRVEERKEGTAKSRVDTDDRKAELQRKVEKKEDEKEQARVEAREKERPNAAIEGDAKKGGDSGGRGDGGASSRMSGIKAAAAQQAQGPREVKQLPPEVKAALEKLVDAVYLAVNDKGLKEFHIELKEGVLSGASLRVSAGKDGVTLKFSGLDGAQKNLIESSKGDLMKRLEGKGLALARIQVA